MGGGTGGGPSLLHVCPPPEMPPSPTPIPCARPCMYAPPSAARQLPTSVKGIVLRSQAVDDRLHTAAQPFHLTTCSGQAGRLQGKAQGGGGAGARGGLGRLACRGGEGAGGGEENQLHVGKPPFSPVAIPPLHPSPELTRGSLQSTVYCKTVFSPVAGFCTLSKVAFPA